MNTSPVAIEHADLISDLATYGITNPTDLVVNPSYEQLFAEETGSDLEGYEQGTLTAMDAVSVQTGIFHRPLAQGQIHRQRRHHSRHAVVE